MAPASREPAARFRSRSIEKNRKWPLQPGKPESHKEERGVVENAGLL